MVFVAANARISVSLVVLRGAFQTVSMLCKVNDRSTLTSPNFDWRTGSRYIYFQQTCNHGSTAISVVLQHSSELSSFHKFASNVSYVAHSQSDTCDIPLWQQAQGRWMTFPKWHLRIAKIHSKRLQEQSLCLAVWVLACASRSHECHLQSLIYACSRLYENEHVGLWGWQKTKC